MDGVQQLLALCCFVTGQRAVVPGSCDGEVKLEEVKLEAARFDRLEKPLDLGHGVQCLWQRPEWVSVVSGEQAFSSGLRWPPSCSLESSFSGEIVCRSEWALSRH